MAVQISGNDITVPRDGTFSRNVSIAGTLTYEDVTNVDSIGLVTARNGIEVGASPGVAASISVDGNMIVSGITTIGGVINASSDIKVGSGVTVGKDGDIFATGVCTATSIKVGTGIVTTLTATGLTVDSGTTNTCATFKSTDAGAVINLTDSAARSSIEQNDTALKIIADTDNSDADSKIQFQVDGGTKATIDSSGNFMIGATSASGILHVEHSGENNSYIIGNTTTSGARIVLQNKNTTANSYTGVLGADAGGQTTSQVLFYSADNDNNEGFMTFETRPSGGVPAERYRIHSNGKHSWNNTTFPYSETFHFYNGNENSGVSFFQNSSNDHTNVIMRHGRALSGYNGYQMLFKRNDGNDVGSIISGASSTSFNTSSDYRLKENQITIPNAIATLNKLKPYEFNFKDDPDYKHLGFFAHEVQEVIPNGVAFGEKDEVYTEDAPNESDDYKKGDMRIQSLDYGKLTPLLTAALQEAISEIETLKTEVAALKSQLNN